MYLFFRFLFQISVIKQFRELINPPSYISKTSRPNATKFYLKHHWGKGKATLGFGPDRFRTLVSMATDSSYRVILGKRRHHVFSNVFYRILFILAGNNNMHESLDEFEIWPDSTMDYGVSCP